MLLERIELSTSPLPRVRSTTELQQLTGNGGRLSWHRLLVKHGGLRQASRMTDPRPTREERLAAKLRENLRRRKAQSRALERAETPSLPKKDPTG